MTPAEARERFATAAVARLATVGHDGTPHLVPVTFAVDGERILMAIDAKPKRGRRLRRLDNIAANPRVALLVDHYDDDWARLWWVRADGDARIIGPSEEQDRAMDLLRERYAQYSATAPIGPVIVVDVRRWSGWSSAEG